MTDLLTILKTAWETPLSEWVGPSPDGESWLWVDGHQIYLDANELHFRSLLSEGVTQEYKYESGMSGWTWRIVL